MSEGFSALSAKGVRTLLIVSLLLAVWGVMPAWAADPLPAGETSAISEVTSPLPTKEVTLTRSEPIAVTDAYESRIQVMPTTKQVGLSVAFIATVLLLLRLSSRWPVAMRLNILLVIGIGAWYLWWRATETLILAPFWQATLSIGLFAAECYGFVTLIFFYAQTWLPLFRGDPPSMDGKEYPSVDVYVTIFDEPIDVLYRTLVGCQAMRYPEGKKTVYVLDDGQRDEVRQTAERVGCRYISRPANTHAKAGNLNHALKLTDGQVIVGFDTDHVPVCTFLERTIGYFQDAKVALVQTAHHFYNPDTYQENLRVQGEIIHEQDLFFQVIQPGRDRYNSAFFCGSGGLFRRSSLEKIGGFITKSATEDIHTSIRLHASGFTSIYVNERLAAGLSAEGFKSYLKQRSRWAQGGWRSSSILNTSVTLNKSSVLSTS